jgi:uncharacterized sulfatase
MNCQRIITVVAVCAFAFILNLSVAFAADRPNIVWIVSEDNSIHYLNHFFEGGAKTPHIEALAAHGLTFDNAFSNAPVCSTARTTLATSCYGPRIGTQFHRRYKMVDMPKNLKMFPAYLRDAGYYTTNNSKQDYNAIPDPKPWDESSNKASWRNRSNTDQPFFHMESHGQSHESSLHFSQQSYENDKTKHNPANVKLADYFPDTPLFRYTHARYLDNMVTIDNIVGQTVAKLKEDNLLEDTFIFYFGDHGGVMPRGKGYIYESGLHVPLVIRVPENFKHLAPAKHGTRLTGFVSFIDFGPTTLNLAGVNPPTGIDGQPFLGEGVNRRDINSRDESFGYADRFDEKYDLIRSIRKGNFQYIRHYQPYLPDGLMNIYRYKMLAYVEWWDLYKAGKLSGPQLHFFQSKTPEALYDCVSDPHQVNNLAGDPKYKDTLLDLRKRLQNKVKSLPDLSFYPESYLVESGLDNPVAFGQSHKDEIATLVDTADLALLPYAKAKPQLLKALKSDNPHVRYWAAMGATSFGQTAADLAPAVKMLLEDKNLIVRVRAAEFLGHINRINPQPILTHIVRLNYINGVPYPPKPPRNKKK